MTFSVEVTLYHFKLSAEMVFKQEKEKWIRT